MHIAAAIFLLTFGLRGIRRLTQPIHEAGALGSGYQPLPIPQRQLLRQLPTYFSLAIGSCVVTLITASLFLNSEPLRTASRSPQCLSVRKLLLLVTFRPWSTDLDAGQFLGETASTLGFLLTGQIAGRIGDLLVVALMLGITRVDWLHTFLAPLYAARIRTMMHKLNRPPERISVSPAWCWLVLLAVVLALNSFRLVRLPALLLCHLLVVCWASWCAFGATAFDKYAAAANEYRPDRAALPWGSRVPESRMRMYALLGGDPGGWLARQLFHHKVSDEKANLRHDLAYLSLIHCAVAATLACTVTWWEVRLAP